MYLITVIVIILTVLGVSVTTASGSLFVVNYLDLPSVLILLFFAIPVLVASGMWKDFVNSFRFALDKSKAANLLELKRAEKAVGLTIHILAFTSIFHAVLQMAAILSEMEDLALLGPQLSVSCLVILYAVAGGILLLPIRGRIQVRILEYMHIDKDSEE